MKKITLRTWTWTKENGWKSTIDEFENIEECYKFIDHVKKFAAPLEREFDIKVFAKEVSDNE